MLKYTYDNGGRGFHIPSHRDVLQVNTSVRDKKQKNNSVSARFGL